MLSFGLHIEKSQTPCWYPTKIIGDQNFSLSYILLGQNHTER